MTEEKIIKAEHELLNDIEFWASDKPSETLAYVSGIHDMTIYLLMKMEGEAKNEQVH